MYTFHHIINLFFTKICFLKVFNFVFSILNEVAKCESASGHYTLGVFQYDHENCETLKEMLAELAAQIRAMDHVEIGGKKYKIEKNFGGDLKFLANIKGTSQANGIFSCPFCTGKKYYYQNRSSTKEFSMLSEDKGARRDHLASDFRSKDGNFYNLYKLILNTFFFFLNVCFFVYLSINVKFISIETTCTYVLKDI